MPSRDALLSHVAGTDIMRAVTGMTLFQFGGQALGTFVAGAAQPLGIGIVLGLQAVILGLGGFATSRLPPQVSRPAGQVHSSPWQQIRAGVRIVAATPNLRVPVFLVTLVGILFIGPYLVIFPLLVRDVYAGGAQELSWVLMTFPVGTILGTFAIRARGGIRRKGQAMLLALGAGAATQLVMGTALPFAAFVGASVVWGLGGAVFINCSRTLVQEAAPPEARGRVLAAYQVGFVGGGPIGTLLAGFVAERIGSLATLTVFGCTMLACVLAVGVLTGARRMT